MKLSKAGASFRTAGRFGKWRRWPWTRKIKSMPLRADNTRSSSSIATATSSARGERAHSSAIMGPDETIYLTDDGDHMVRKCTFDGKVLLTLGVLGKPAFYQSGEPFNRCTH